MYGQDTRYVQVFWYTKAVDSCELSFPSSYVRIIFYYVKTPEINVFVKTSPASPLSERCHVEFAPVLKAFYAS